jgi:hypothetical protein
MAPPPPATAVADSMRSMTVPQESRANTDIMAVTKGASASWYILLGLAVLGVLQAVATLTYQTRVGLG